MDNPWKSIKLSDYENHMSLDTVKQLQVLNSMMKEQLSIYPVNNVMILGIAGGNGLEHIDTEKYSIVYGIDVNYEYLQEVQKRYKKLNGILKCLCLDLITETVELPASDLIIANLLIEYIGYECFQKAVRQVNPEYVSCGIQINIDDEFVSDSPYLRSFKGLNSVHHQMKTDELIKKMYDINYKCISSVEHLLPNGKKLVQIDFKRS